jgi:C-terminal processing protease CtpA/Prc
MHRVIALAGALTLAGCVQFRTLVQDSGDLSGAPAYEEVAESSTAAAQPFVGIEVEESIAGSLDQLEFLSGLRVAGVTPGSSAESAGVRVNDRIVRAGGAEVARRDQWSAFLAGCKPGDPAVLTVERDGALRDVTVAVVSRGAAGAPGAARRFVERRKARVVVETVMDETGGRRRALAQVVELAPSSPLREEGITEGTKIVALDGEPVRGAADFARRVSEKPYGADVTLEIVHGDGTKKVDVTLYRPPRELTAFRLWPLFAWAEAADGSSSGCEILDLWLIWLFKYERKGETRAWNILRVIHWESGQGQLSEEPAGRSR